MRTGRCVECANVRSWCIAVDSDRVTHAQGRAGPAARSPPNTLAELTELTLSVASPPSRASPNPVTRAVGTVSSVNVRSRCIALDSTRVTHARGRALSRHSGRRDSGCRLTTFTFAAPRHCYQRNMRCGECSIARHECVPIDSHRVTHARGRAGPAARSPPSTLCRLTTCTFASPTRSHAKWALCRVC